jgi:hypothetical protein
MIDQEVVLAFTPATAPRTPGARKLSSEVEAPTSTSSWVSPTTQKGTLGRRPLWKRRTEYEY